MSFLHQLKAQADALRDHGAVQMRGRQASLDATEAACQTVARYFADLAAQLDVIVPPAATFSLDDRAAWPAMAARGFRSDARKKLLRGHGVFASVGLGWRIAPRDGDPSAGEVSVNFPIELERVQTRLAESRLDHQRTDVRHPESGKLQAIQFDYSTELRAGVVATPDHDAGHVAFRLHNVTGFGTRQREFAAAEIDTAWLDKLARLLMQLPSRFLEPA